MKTIERTEAVDVDIARLERNFKRAGSSGKSMALGFIIAMLVVLAYCVFGTRVDRARFTTDVTPIHVHLGSISSKKQIVESTRSLQL